MHLPKPRTRKRRGPRWKMHFSAGHVWPIPIGREGELATPVWIWGDVKLALAIQTFLNKRKEAE